MAGNLDFLFNPRSIAIVGASNTPGKLSTVIMESIKGKGFKGRVYPVNPKYDNVGGLKCYGDLRSIGESVNIAVFAVPSKEVIGLIKGAGGIIKSAIVISGGFKEAGAEGALLEKELKDISLEQGIRIIGPNCMGIFDNVSNVDTLFIPADRIKRPKKGSISILSQSGSFALTAMDEFAAEGIGVSRVVSYGNKIDIDEADCLEFLATDDSTDAVVLYIEGVEDGRRFVEAAKACSVKKTVMAMKVGRSPASILAARSHTGALAGRYEIWRAAFKKADSIELTSYEELLDAAKALAGGCEAGGGRVMIITNGGGMGVNIADACAEKGLDMPPLPEDKRQALKAIFPPYFTVSNPLDLTGSSTDELYREALLKTMQGDDYDMAIVTVLWGPPNLTDNLPALLAGAAKACGKPVIICSPGGEYTVKKRALFQEAGFQIFPGPESAVRAAVLLAKKSVLKKKATDG